MQLVTAITGVVVGIVMVLRVVMSDKEHDKTDRSVG